MFFLDDTDAVKLTTDVNGSVKAHASYIDSDQHEDRLNTLVTTAGTNSIVASPPSGKKRNVEFITVTNVSTVVLNAIVKHDNGSTVVPLWSGRLAPNEFTSMNALGKWTAYTSGGIPKQSSITALDVQSFTSAGIYMWVKPAGRKVAKVGLFGGGGAGGTGSLGGGVNPADAGAGGGGGAYNERLFVIDDLCGTEIVVVGRGGIFGVTGVKGGQASSFGQQIYNFAGIGGKLMAGGGGGGSNGTNAGGQNSSGGGGGGTAGSGITGIGGSTNGTGGDPQPNPIAVSGAVAGSGASGFIATNNNCAEWGGGGGGFGGGNNTPPTGSAGGSSMKGAGGGGGGAGTVGVSPVFSVPFAGGVSNSYTPGGGGAAGSNGAPATNGSPGANGSASLGGQGGGGGGIDTSGVGISGAGGNGGWPGGGGGGAASTLTAALNNIGGNGADGGAWVTSY
jgi:hypothetical protein